MKKFKAWRINTVLVYALALVSALAFQSWTSRQLQIMGTAAIAPAAIIGNISPVVAEDNAGLANETPPATDLHTTENESVEQKDVSKSNITAEGFIDSSRNEQLADRKSPAIRPSGQTQTPTESKEPVVVPPTAEPEVKPTPVPETKPAPTASTYDTDLNNYVLDIIPTYKIGSYPYLLNTDYQNYNGVTENLYYGSSLIAKAHPSGNRASHCSGITFEVFFKAMKVRNAKLGLTLDNFNAMTFSQLQDFQMLWYVAAGNKRYSNLAIAIEKYGLGKQIHNLEEAKRGDFLDFSRTNNTGHSVIFLNWVRNNDGKIIGLYYWSSQGSTNGINYVTEYFDTSGKGNVISSMLYIGRVLPVKSYQ